MKARSGIALVAALALMMFIAVLVIGGVASSTLAQRASRLSRTDAALTAAADFAVNTVLADPLGFQLAALPLGQPRTFDVASPGSSAIRTQVAVTRLPGGVLWLVANGTLDGLDQGRRRFNVVARFPAIGSIPAAAVIARGGGSVGGAVVFPPDTARGADCQLPPDADIIVAPGSSISASNGARVLTQSRASDSSTYYLMQSQLDAFGLAPGFTRVRGDTIIAGGAYAGIMVVDGNLTLSGPFSLTGLLIVRGRVVARAGSFSLTGALLAFGRGSDSAPGVDIDGATLRYSRCAVQSALWAALPPRPVSQRAWAELF